MDSPLKEKLRDFVPPKRNMTFEEIIKKLCEMLRELLLTFDEAAHCWSKLDVHSIQQSYDLKITKPHSICLFSYTANKKLLSNSSVTSNVNLLHSPEMNLCEIRFKFEFIFQNKNLYALNVLSLSGR